MAFSEFIKSERPNTKTNLMRNCIDSLNLFGLDTINLVLRL